MSAELELWRELATGQISDAMDDLGIARGVISGLHTLAAMETPMVGRAFTLRQAPARDAAAKARHVEVARDLAQPDDVIVIDVGGRLDVCSWGYAHTLRAMTRGAAGLIIDGAVRDVAEIRTTGFALFCRGYSPVRSTGALETISMREPVVIGGVQVKHGDLLVGDEDGIICIPDEHADKILAQAQKIAAAEQERDDKLRAALPETQAR